MMAKMLMIVMMTMMKMVWFTWDETRLGCSNHFWIDQAATEKLKFKLKGKTELVFKMKTKFHPRCKYRQTFRQRMRNSTEFL